VTHNYLGPVLTAAAVHLDTSIPNFVVQEYARTDETSKWSGFQGVLQRQGGYLYPPETPGLGIRLIDTHVDVRLGPLGDRPLHEIPLRRDGSVVYAV
jgi:galactonate dehydratase